MSSFSLISFQQLNQSKKAEIRYDIAKKSKMKIVE